MLLSVGACGRAEPDGLAASTGVIRPSLTELHQLLTAELARQGIEPERVSSRAVTGELSRPGIWFSSIGGAEPSLANPVEVQIAWMVEQPGDFDYNGIVNINDLTPLARYLGRSVEYGELPTIPGRLFPGNVNWENWRAGRCDGDRNGLVTINDISTLAKHFGERVDGYRVYRKDPSASDFVALENPDAPGQPLLFSKAYMGGTGDAAFVVEPGVTQFYVVAYDASTDTEGPPSEIISARSNSQPVLNITVELERDQTPAKLLIDASASFDSDGTIETYTYSIEHRLPSGEWQGNAPITINTAAQGPQETAIIHAAGEYRLQAQINDVQGGYSIGDWIYFDVAKGGTRAADWDFSIVPTPVGRALSNPALAAVAGRAAVGYGVPALTASELGYNFTSAPPDGSIWTTPVVV
jgi:hypothetical protein